MCGRIYYWNCRKLEIILHWFVLYLICTMLLSQYIHCMSSWWLSAYYHRDPNTLHIYIIVNDSKFLGVCEKHGIISHIFICNVSNLSLYHLPGILELFIWLKVVLPELSSGPSFRPATGLVMAPGLLFATGYFIYGNLQLGGILMFIALISAYLLSKVWVRIKVDVL